MIGIPYAFHVEDEDSPTGWSKSCPICGTLCPTVERKDFESFSGTEYAAHYAAEHAALTADQVSDAIRERRGL